MARPVFYVKPFRVKFMLEQSWQCNYIVTLQRVGATIVALEEQYVLYILSACL